MSALCTALITKLPIHSHNHSGNRKSNSPLQRDPRAAIDSIFFFFFLTSRESWLRQCHTNCKCCVCVTRYSDSLNACRRTDLCGKGFSPLSLYNHIKSIHVGVFSLSGQWGCVKCLTGGHLPHPQSWPFHHDWINYQTACLIRWKAAPPHTICIKMRPTVQHDKLFPVTKLLQKNNQWRKRRRMSYLMLIIHSMDHISIVIAAKKQTQEQFLPTDCHSDRQLNQSYSVKNSQIHFYYIFLKFKMHHFMSI